MKPVNTTTGTAGSADTVRLAGIAYLAGAPQFIGNVVPLLLGAIADRFHATPVQLGTINSCYTALTLLTTATAPWWVARLPGAGLTLASAIGICVVFAFSGAAPGIPALYVLFALAGAFAGVMGGPSNARIGRSANPGRWWSLSMSFQMVVAALYSVGVTAVLQPRFGALSALAAMTLMFLPCLIAAIGARRDLAETSSVVCENTDVRARVARGPGVAGRGPLIAAFTGATLYAFGAVAYWIFLERMAREASVSAGLIGVAIGVSTMCAAAAAALAAALARRLRLVLVIGSLAGLLSYAVMLQPSAVTVFASACLYNVGWGMLIPGFQSVIRGADHTDRLFVAGPATVFVSAVVAGPLAGLVAQFYGYRAVMILCILVTLVAFALGLLGYTMTRERQESFSGLARSGH